jgi:hypothetical protein
MSSLLLLDGSPRGARSNSAKMLSHVAEGWERAGGDAPEVLHLARPADFRRAVAAFGEADRNATVLLGMPLYTDQTPGLVKAFVEELACYVGREDAPTLGFLVQSGFDEACHSRPVEAYLAKLATRLACPYAGTIVRGGGEALQVMPDEANKKMWERLRRLGDSLERAGVFDAEGLKEFSGMERLPAWAAAALSVALKVPITQSYFGGQLKKNGAWERRFAAPYAPAAHH